MPISTGAGWRSATIAGLAQPWVDQFCMTILIHAVNCKNSLGEIDSNRDNAHDFPSCGFDENGYFHRVQGREFVSRYESGIYTRCFCQKCGTSLGEIESQEDSFPIAANCFDDDPIVRNLFHEFVINKPAWYDIYDDAKQFPEHPVKS